MIPGYLVDAIPWIKPVLVVVLIVLVPFLIFVPMERNRIKGERDK